MGLLIQRARYHLWGQSSSWLTIALADNHHQVMDIVNQDTPPRANLMAWSGGIVDTWDVDGVLYDRDGRILYRVLQPDDPGYNHAWLTLDRYRDPSVSGGDGGAHYALEDLPLFAEKRHDDME